MNSTSNPVRNSSASARQKSNTGGQDSPTGK